MGSRPDLRYEPRLGIALGGGGALGAAHVGVLQELDKRGIQPSVVVGTSAGAVIGAAYAAGIDLAELEAIVVHSRWGDFGTFSFTPGLGILDTAGLRETIDRLAGPDLMIEDLPIRFGAVATDLITRDVVLLDNGSVADAVAASISVPGLFRPSRLHGHLLVDGGVIQNLPLEATFEMGARHVVGVRLAPEWDALPTFRTGAHVHEFEIREDVTMIRPRIGQRSQWVTEDLPALVQLGRDAVVEALGDYPEVDSGPAGRDAPGRLASFFRQHAPHHPHA
ncbi:patatin-like phospholipase family protein [Demequina sp. TTPB684]|uniref:patatin-like phospholipase family protein n=1 Tax=unclassified Demequina TaxID=2620311 RepID=UPI001CF46EFE|nr:MULTISPECIES: patatin-like phospholipase family protein [unclassified Demequina]MCB2411633.1 patatin-like phospholipase family protein [Demequina sp. TTPB684]UPU88601.1 patatin-like phospholipase family protein [Demequina sp. TMPB413]